MFRFWRSRHLHHGVRRLQEQVQHLGADFLSILFSLYDRNSILIIEKVRRAFSYKKTTPVDEIDFRDQFQQHFCSAANLYLQFVFVMFRPMYIIRKDRL